jgi:hypothetical protein
VSANISDLLILVILFAAGSVIVYVWKRIPATIERYQAQARALAEARSQPHVLPNEQI